LDVAALSDRFGTDWSAGVLVGIDDYYDATAGGGSAVASQLVRQLGEPRPKDHRTIRQLTASAGRSLAHASGRRTAHARRFAGAWPLSWPAPASLQGHCRANRPPWATTAPSGAASPTVISAVMLCEQFFALGTVDSPRWVAPGA
jgi:hypothetical protein